jgi:LPS sulfotransferase NodH
MSAGYVIVCQARTGSTMLATALQQHPEICAHGEVLNFRHDDTLEFFGLNYNRPGAIHHYLRKMRFENPVLYLDRYVLFPGRFRAVGFKFKYEELSHPELTSAREYVVGRNDLRIIHMVREDLLARLISEHVAVKITRRFNSRGEPIVVPDVRFRLDTGEVKAAFERSLGWQAEFRAAFQSHPVLEVTYEAFMNDPEGAFARVTRFLEVEHRPFEPGTRKIEADRLPREMVENWDEVAAAMKDTPYERFVTRDAG